MATGGATDEYFDNLCSVCTRKNKNTEAQNFCTDCQESFCSICVNSHNDFLALRSHQILDKAKFRPGSSVQFPMVPSERCIVHGHKPVDMYCRQHDAVGCATCMVIKHGACKDKVYIPDYIKNTTNVQSSSTIAKQLDTIASSLSKLQKKFLKERKNIKSQKETSLQEIRKLRIQINQQLNQLEKNTVNDLEKVFKSLTDMVEATLTDLQAAITEVQSAQNSLKSAGGTHHRCLLASKWPIMLPLKLTRKSQQHNTKYLPPTFPLFLIRCFSLYSMSYNDLGSFSVTEKPETLPRYPDTFPSVASTQTNTASYAHQSSFSLLQIKNSKKYTVTEKSDKEKSAIWSACALDDGTIILSDCSNNKLKRLNNISYKVQDSFDVPGNAYQVCAISNLEVALCCSWENLVQFVSVGHKMQMTRQVSTGFRCFGLAYADEKLFISDQYTSVYVFTLTGSRLQQFSVPQAKQDAYIHLLSLAVSSDNTSIYVAHKRKGLIILDRNGQLVGEFTDPKLKEAQSVSLCKNNSVFVCGSESCNVLQFTPDGQLIGEVLKTDKKCYSVCYCKKNSKLIVDCDDEIAIYDIIE